MGQNSIIRSIFARRAKKAAADGRSPPQELEIGLRSGPKKKGSLPKRAITRTPIQTKQSAVTISSNKRVFQMLLVNESDDGSVAANHDEEGETPGETEHEDEVQKLLHTKGSEEKWAVSIFNQYHA